MNGTALDNSTQRENVFSNFVLIHVSISSFKVEILNLLPPLHPLCALTSTDDTPLSAHEVTGLLLTNGPLPFHPQDG